MKKYVATFVKLFIRVIILCLFDTWAYFLFLAKIRNGKVFCNEASSNGQIGLHSTINFVKEQSGYKNDYD